MQFKKFVPIFLLLSSVNTQNMDQTLNPEDENVDFKNRKKCPIIESPKGDFNVVGESKDVPGECINNLVLEKDNKKYCMKKGNNLLKCKEKGTEKCLCGTIGGVGRVAGGKDAVAGKFPWMAQVTFE